MESRSIEVFVWFHDGDAEAESFPNPGDVVIRAMKDGVRVQMNSSAAWTGPTAPTDTAVAEDHRTSPAILRRVASGNQ